MRAQNFSREQYIGTVRMQTLRAAIQGENHLEEEKVTAGMTANGSKIDISAFRMSFMPVRSSMSEKKATENVGIMAIDLHAYGHVVRIELLFCK